MATLDLHQKRRQPIYAFFEEDSTLDCFPAWQRERLRRVRDEGDCNVPDGDDDHSSPWPILGLVQTLGIGNESERGGRERHVHAPSGMSALDRLAAPGSQQGV